MCSLAEIVVDYEKLYQTRKVQHIEGLQKNEGPSSEHSQSVMSNVTWQNPSACSNQHKGPLSGTSFLLGVGSRYDV